MRPIASQTTKRRFRTKPVPEDGSSAPIRERVPKDGDKTTEKNPKDIESVPVPDRLNMKMLDLSWDLIRKSQETDVTLQKIFELLRDPDAPTEVNQFGMGVVNLWNQRKEPGNHQRCHTQKL